MGVLMAANDNKGDNVIMLEANKMLKGKYDSTDKNYYRYFQLGLAFLAMLAILFSAGNRTTNIIISSPEAQIKAISDIALK